MTWKDLTALPECNRPGCCALKADGGNYCAEHWTDQKRRQVECTRISRAAWLGPLFTWAVHRRKRVTIPFISIG